jgi:spore coat polysaccharide biosynthesis protein SpsF
LCEIGHFVTVSKSHTIRHKPAGFAAILHIDPVSASMTTVKKPDPRVVLILQARMGSTRLPGKSMMDLAGAPLLARILERVKRAKKPHAVVMATTERPEDDVLVTLAEGMGVPVFRGSQNDLLDRYYQAAKAFGADIVLRLPADNATPEPDEIDNIVDFHLATDFVFTTNLAQALGRGYPDGIGAEALDFWALKEVWTTRQDAGLNEHPHLNFFNYSKQEPVNPRYTVGAPKCAPDIARPDVVLDVNTQKQYDFIKALYEYLYPRNPEFNIRDTISWYDNIHKKQEATA